jgi:hypothetical protein
VAFLKGSYYENVKMFSADEKGDTVFEGTRALPLGKPDPVIEHSVSIKERLDGIAHHYYAQSRDWRWIVFANTDVIFAEDLLFDPQPTDESGEIIDPDGRERLGHLILIPRRKGAR